MTDNRTDGLNNKGVSVGTIVTGVFVGMWCFAITAGIAWYVIVELRRANII